MKKAILAIGVLMHLGSAHAIEDSPNVPGSLRVMEIDGQHLVSGFQSMSHALRVLERGYWVVSRVSENSAPATAEHDSGFESMIRSLDQQIVRQSAVSVKDQQDTLSEEGLLSAFRRQNFDEKPTASPAPIVKSEASPVDPFDAKGLGKFRECARRTLPQLCLKLAALRRGDAFSALNADAAVAAERGDGEKITSEGLACGRYLGRYGLAPGSAIEEIKILSTFDRARSVESVWRLFVSYSSSLKNEGVMAPLFWRFAWKETSYRIAVEDREPLPIAVLTEQYRRYARSVKNVWTEDLKSLDARIQKDQEQFR